VADGWLKMYSDGGPSSFQKAEIEGEEGVKDMFA
jgi:hypothetical protein